MEPNQKEKPSKEKESLLGRLKEKQQFLIANAPKDCCKPMPDYQEEFLDITNVDGEADRLLLLHIRPSIDQIIRTTNDSTFLRIGDKA